MTITMTNEQFDMLKYIVEEFTDCAHDQIMEYQKLAEASSDTTIKNLYEKYAKEEEEIYNESKDMRGFLDEFEPDPE